MNVVVLGAGASKAYAASKTGCRMPMARDFFKTYEELDIAADSRVLIDKILLFGKEHLGLEFAEMFEANLDIEELHTRIEEELMRLRARAMMPSFGIEESDLLFVNGAYNQLTFLFATVLNEIQNGPVSEWHRRLAKELTSVDRILTFNWDTLMDRALFDDGRWTTDSGYGFTPRKILRGSWTDPVVKSEAGLLLLKLHGSTNWLTSHPSDMRHNGRTQTTPLDTVHVYESTDEPYDTFKGRFIPGYEPFSFGYYPPNIPDDPGRSAKKGYSFVRASPKRPDLGDGISGTSGLVSIPLIIPPVKEKQYEAFGRLYSGLWDRAEKALQTAERISLIGYSFPVTDVRSQDLFRSAFSRRSELPHIIVVNPKPEAIVKLFTDQFDIPLSQITVRKEYLSATSPTYL